MKLSINVFGFEVANLKLDLHQEDNVVQVIEREGGELLSKGIGRLSAWWVTRGMKR